MHRKYRDMYCQVIRPPEVTASEMPTSTTYSQHEMRRKYRDMYCQVIRPPEVTASEMPRIQHTVNMKCTGNTETCTAKSLGHQRSLPQKRLQI